jgi:hypothetical protein
MTLDQIDHTGFSPRRHARTQGHRSAAVAQLVTSAALVFSIAIAATAVSIGIARADGLAATASDPGTHVAIATFIALTGMAGLTAGVSFARVRARRRK